jgi:TAF6 C-terminal HEAT repeat domain
VRETAIASLRSDPGLHQLVPYLVAFIAEKVRLRNVVADILDHPQSQERSDFECYASDYMGIAR